jgi:hypothetical protein
MSCDHTPSRWSWWIHAHTAREGCNHERCGKQNLAIVHAGGGDAQTVTCAAMRIPFELKERKHLTGVSPSPELLSVVGCRGERPSQHTVTLVHAGARSQGIIAVRFTSSLR